MDAAGSGDTVEYRHPHIHQHNIRMNLSDYSQRRLAVARFADDFKIRLTREEAAKSLAEKQLIVG
jgi:hypothetical protein